ncbi:glycosyltransferase family 2 protein [Pseudonocardia alni]|uniref:glycosyltransferase family 2 protein n=1 Tax=Pseudonocardia alni TaxID=33907 RepID=UPI00279C9FA1|nr:glycosyltransferase family 2 protein [Pseudonocardia alni]
MAGHEPRYLAGRAVARTSGGPVTDVTVVIPARNRAGVLGKALASVRCQSLQPAAVVVIDDGSDDDTGEVARRFGVEVIAHEVPRGAAEARNSGVRWATTRWVAFLDSDDEWTTDHLSTMMAHAEGNVLLTSVCLDTDGRAHGNTSGRLRPISQAMLFFPQNVVCTSTVVADRSSVLEAGLFREIDRAEDLDLWVRLLAIGRGCAVSTATCRYFIDDGYATPEMFARNRAGANHVVELFENEPWMTWWLRECVRGQALWDAFRHHQHRGDVVAAARALTAVATRPWLVGPIVATIWDRRRGWTFVADRFAERLPSESP